MRKLLRTDDDILYLDKILSHFEMENISRKGAERGILDAVNRISLTSKLSKRSILEKIIRATYKYNRAHLGSITDILLKVVSDVEQFARDFPKYRKSKDNIFGQVFTPSNLNKVNLPSKIRMSQLSETLNTLFKELIDKHTIPAKTQLVVDSDIYGDKPLKYNPDLIYEEDMIEVLDLINDTIRRTIKIMRQYGFSDDEIEVKTYSLMKEAINVEESSSKEDLFRNLELFLFEIAEFAENIEEKKIVPQSPISV